MAAPLAAVVPCPVVAHAAGTDAPVPAGRGHDDPDAVCALPIIPAPRSPAPWPGRAVRETRRRQRTRLERLVALVAASVVAVATLAVGTALLLRPPTVAPEAVQRAIVRTTALSVGVAPTDVRCPAPIPSDAGALLACTGKLDQQAIAFTVRQISQDGRFTVVHDRVLRADAVLPAVRQRLGAAAACGPRGATVLVNPPGAALRCTDGTRPLDVVLTVDDRGAVTGVTLH